MIWESNQYNVVCQQTKELYDISICPKISEGPIKRKKYLSVPYLGMFITVEGFSDERYLKRGDKTMTKMRKIVNYARITMIAPMGRISHVLNSYLRSKYA